MIKQAAVALMLSTLVFGADSFAQQSSAGESKSAVTEKYQEAMKNMNQKMKAEPKTGNADHDFIVMMIEHHRGAIKMGEILLIEGKNEELRKLTEEAVKKQKEDIAKLEKILEQVKANQDTGTKEQSEDQ